MNKLCIFLMFLLGTTPIYGQKLLSRHPAPADNPLKGLVPYDGDKRDRFPHSMEFFYVPLSDLMTGPGRFNWQPLEEKLTQISSRGHQAVFRVWIEYPGHKEGLPKHLEQAGVRVTEWLNTNTDPFPRQLVRTPDYEDPRLREALRTFIHALGRRYDGDPRIGFITAGLLGTWGEWHTHPRVDLMPSKTVQTEVMDAYEAAFRITHVLLRYPAGPDNFHHAPNHRRRFGYHDDSFAWATLDTGRKEDNWFFVPALKTAGALNRWKTAPIGGEIRPELWGLIFDNAVPHPQAQDFLECVRQTHVTWLMDTGMFAEKQNAARVKNAVRAVRLMGYEFHVQQVQVVRRDGNLDVSVELRNTGVAPFYYDWPVELVLADAAGNILQRKTIDWHIHRLLPGQIRTWKHSLPADQLPRAARQIGVRIKNPMPTGLPLRFANDPERMLSDGTLLLDTFD